MTARRMATRIALIVALTAAASTASSVVVARGAQQADTPSPSSADRRVERDLASIADAWAEGGGTYGFPFWEKAQERWRAGTVSASVLREYTTGYRDNLQLGCELLDATDVDTEVAQEVRENLVDACRTRVDALRAQKRQLDRVVERGAAVAGELDAEELADLDQDVAEHAATVVEQMQQSWRSTREAMDLAQAELDARGLDRLPEDAFL